MLHESGPKDHGDEILKFGKLKLWWIFGGKLSVNFLPEN